MTEMAGIEWVQGELFPADHYPCADCGSCFACGTECIPGCNLREEDP